MRHPQRNAYGTPASPRGSDRVMSHLSTPPPLHDLSRHATAWPPPEALCMRGTDRIEGQSTRLRLPRAEGGVGPDATIAGEEQLDEPLEGRLGPAVEMQHERRGARDAVAHRSPAAGADGALLLLHRLEELGLRVESKGRGLDRLTSEKDGRVG